MTLTDKQKKYGIIGAGVVLVGWLLFRPKKAAAQEVEKPQLPAEVVLPVPGAGGGMPTPTAPATRDPATGAVIAGPSTPIVAPPPTAADTLHTVQTGESWSNIASRSYGDYRWWPYLWDYNRESSTQFTNPDDLKRGATIKIPPAAPPDATYKSAIFARAAAHRAYWVAKSKGQKPSFPQSVLERTPVPTFSGS